MSVAPALLPDHADQTVKSPVLITSAFQHTSDFFFPFISLARQGRHNEICELGSSFVGCPQRPGQVEVTGKTQDLKPGLPRGLAGTPTLGPSSATASDVS